MIIKNDKGTYFLERNYRDAWNEGAFIDKYIEECYDKYPYLVGDISSGILRLKGFNNDPKGSDYIGNVDDYLETSCAIGCAYYLLKRIKNDEIEKHEKLETSTTSDIHITPIQKVAFDKEQLVLESNPKKKANIVLDIDRVNSIPKPTVSADILEFIKEDKQASLSQNNYRRNEPKEEPKEENVTTYVSGSADFDPSKKKDFGRNNFNRNNNKNNNKNQNQNNNKNNNFNNNKNQNNNNKNNNNNNRNNKNNNRNNNNKNQNNK